MQQSMAKVWRDMVQNCVVACTIDGVHWVYMQCTLSWVLYTLYTLYTEFWSWDRGFWCTESALGAGNSVRFSNSFKPLYARAWRMYTLYTMFTHFFLARGRAHVCYSLALLAIIYAQIFRILGAMHNVQSRGLTRSLRFLSRPNFLTPKFHENEGLTTLICPIHPVLPDPFSLSLVSASDLSDHPRHLRRIRVQMPSNFDIRPSPCEQPPKMLHRFHIPNPMWTTEPTKLSNRTHFHPVKRGTHHRLIELPPQTSIPERISTTHQPNRVLPVEIWLDTKRLAMCVQFKRCFGSMRLRRDRDRCKPRRPVDLLPVTLSFRSTNSSHSTSPLPIIALGGCRMQPPRCDPTAATAFPCTAPTSVQSLDVLQRQTVQHSSIHRPLRLW